MSTTVDTKHPNAPLRPFRNNSAAARESIVQGIGKRRGVGSLVLLATAAIVAIIFERL